MILYGGKDDFIVESKSLGVKRDYKIDFEGLENYLESSYEEAATASIKRWAASYMDSYNCTTCNGSRLKKEALHFKLNNKTISDLVSMDLKDLYEWIADLSNNLSENEKKIGSEIIKEILVRLQFLLDVGLQYLSLIHI